MRESYPEYNAPHPMSLSARFIRGASMLQRRLTVFIAAAGITGATVFVQASQSDSSRRYIAPRSASDTTQPPFSGAVLAGNTLYLSGEIGTDANRRVPD